MQRPGAKLSLSFEEGGQLSSDRTWEAGSLANRTLVRRSLPHRIWVAESFANTTLGCRLFPAETWEAGPFAHGTLGCRLSPGRTWEAKPFANGTSERRSFLNRIREAGPFPKGAGGAEVFPGAGRGRTLQVDCCFRTVQGPHAQNLTQQTPMPNASWKTAPVRDMHFCSFLVDKTYSQHAINMQSTYNQHTVNIQSTYSQHTVNTIHFSLFFLWKCGCFQNWACSVGNDPASQILSRENLRPNVPCGNDPASQVLSRNHLPPSAKLKLSFAPGPCIPRTPSVS